MKIGDLVREKYVTARVGIVVRLNCTGNLLIVWAEDGKQEWLPDWHVVEVTDETR